MHTSTREARRWSRALLAIGMAGALCAAAGCGTASSSSSATGSSAVDPPASAQVISTCKQMITAESALPTFKAPGPPLDASKLRGKKVMFVSLSQAVPAIAQDAAATQQAGSAVGIHVSVFDTKGDVRLMQQAIQQAVTENYDAIILLGIPLKVTQSALAQAHAAGIPIVSELNNEPAAGQPGQGAGPNVFGTTGPPRFGTGQLLACKAVVDAKGNAHVVIFGAKDLEPSQAEVNGMRSILSKCAGCTVSENSTPTAEWETQLPGLAASTVRSNPNANYFLPLYDGMGIFVTSGVQEAGGAGHVKVASFNATPAALKLIQNGNVLAADPGQANSWMAWQGLDQAMRGMLHMSAGNPVVPMRYFDSNNLRGVNVNDENALFGGEFRQDFLKLWGVTG